MNIIENLKTIITNHNGKIVDQGHILLGLFEDPEDTKKCFWNIPYEIKSKITSCGTTLTFEL